MKERGWNGKGAFEMSGSVKNVNGVEEYKLKGRWDNELIAINVRTGQEILVWKRNPLPENHDHQYFFT